MKLPEPEILLQFFNLCIPLLVEITLKGTLLAVVKPYSSISWHLPLPGSKERNFWSLLHPVTTHLRIKIGMFLTFPKRI
jgi:hypothetical protein